MIVLDIHLDVTRFRTGLGRNRGGVRSLRDIAPGKMQDAGLLPYLIREHHCTFVTLNWSDFYRKVEGHLLCCFLCLDVGTQDSTRAGRITRRVLQSPILRTWEGRRGRVVRVMQGRAVWYERLSEPEDPENEVFFEAL